MSRFGLRGLVLPALIGVLALAAATYFGYLTFRDVWVSAGPTSTETRPAPAVKTDRVVSRAGGFRLRAPRDMSVTRDGTSIRLTDEAQSLVVTLGPGEGGALRAVSTRYLRTIERSYREVRLLRSVPERVDGRPALVSSGRAVNERGVGLRFVALVVSDRPRNYTITAFAAADSDPADVLPRVNAIANSFAVLGR